MRLSIQDIPTVAVAAVLGACTEVQAQPESVPEPLPVNVRAVDVDTPCSGTNCDGTRWDKAYRYLQSALAEARLNVAVTEIWVAEGTYYPDENQISAAPNGTNNRSDTFLMRPENLRIMGGFDGTEELSSERDPFANETILSGDIDKDSTLDDDNTYHVVMVVNGRPSAVLDGFTVTMGYASDAPAPPTISATMPHVPSGAGGGLISYYFDPDPPQGIPPADPTIVRCLFHTNIAEKGGAIFITATEQGGATVLNTVFRDNEAEEGAGIYVDDFLPQSRPNIYNSLFYDNEAKGDGGGAVYCKHCANVRLVNCTITRNTASSSSGGGVFHDEPCPPPPVPDPTAALPESTRSPARQ